MTHNAFNLYTDVIIPLKAFLDEDKIIDDSDYESVEDEQLAMSAMAVDMKSKLMQAYKTQNPQDE